MGGGCNDGSVTVKPELLEGLAEEYGKAVSIVEDIETAIGNLSTSLNENYQGGATDLYGSGLQRYKDHAEFIRLCLQAGEDYVRYAKDTMCETDTELSEGYGG